MGKEEEEEDDFPFAGKREAEGRDEARRDFCVSSPPSSSLFLYAFTVTSPPVKEENVKTTEEDQKN